jgi:tRNA (guanine-N7-)-methyltransferase
LLEHFLPRLRWPEVAFAAPMREVWLEVGFGGGEHAHALSLAWPDVGIIAAEVFETGICSLLSRLAPDEAAELVAPANLRLFTDDARHLIRAMPDAGLARLFLMFPDPWPKARHAKRRFVHPEVLEDVARVLKPLGEWRIASDDPTYQEWTDAVIAGQAKFTLRSRSEIRPQGWPGTRYEGKAIAAGRRPVYWVLEKM